MKRKAQSEGGRRGGLTAAARMTPEQRKERAVKAIRQRWANRPFQSKTEGIDFKSWWQETVNQHAEADAAKKRDWFGPQGCACAACRAARLLLKAKEGGV